MSGLEIDLINQAFESNYIAPLEPMVDAFEKDFAEYAAIGQCLAESSGTTEIHLGRWIIK